VPDPLVLRAAAHKALATQQRGTLRTRSVHAEVVFNLSGSKHVSFLIVEAGGRWWGQAGMGQVSSRRSS